MILTKVHLKNFMCYYGDNVFEFTEGLNVVIGDNGYGKSKLFDAIYWVMYDECFDTSADSFKKTSQLNTKLISDRAIHEAEHGQIDCLVSLTFYDDRRENTYTLERSLTATKKGDAINFAVQSTQRVMERKGVLSSQLIEDLDIIERLKKRILPDNIKHYMWFQGEQIDNIIDFKKSDTLTRAINVLSDISKYDEISQITDSLFTTVKNDLSRKQRAQSKDIGESDRLTEEINDLKIRLANYTQDLKMAENGRKEAMETSESLYSKLEVAEKIRELDSEKNKIEADLNKTKIELLELRNSVHKKLFTRMWVLKGTNILFKQYSTIYSNYQDSKLDLRARIQAEKKISKEMQTRLPINVPEPFHVQKMLDLNRCLVCDRPAEEGSKAYEAIKALISSNDEALKRLDYDTNKRSDFSNTFEKLYRNGLQLEGRISDIDDDINNTLTKIDELFTKTNDLRNDLEEIDNQIKNFISDSSISINEAKKIIQKLQTNQTLTNKYSNDIGSYENRIQNLEKNISLLESKFNNLVIGSLPERLLKKVDISKHLNEIAISTRKRVFQELISRLEKEANKHYKNMTQDNKAVRGLIRLTEYNGNYTPELIDSDGNQLGQINMGNILLIKLATIMAIVSARKNTLDTDLYTLISDAPMSVFGEDYTIGFCKTVSQVYRQSIIMSKDFYKNLNLRQQLLTSDEIKLGKVYVIEPNIPDANREGRHKLATEIKGLN